MQKRGGTMVSVGRGERDEELALFHEVRRREHERKSSAIHPLPPHDADQPSPGSGNASFQHQMSSSPAKMTLANKLGVNNTLTADLNGKSDDLLTAELGKNDYDWLLTPPGTPLVNHSKLNSALDGGDFLSQMEPVSLVQSLAAIKTSRFSSTQADANSRMQGATLLTDPELGSRKGQNGVSRFNGLPGSSTISTSNSMTTLAPKKTPLTPRSVSASRPASPTRRTPLSSAHTFNPKTPLGKTKPSSAPGSHPTTPTSHQTAALALKGGGNFGLSSSTTTRKTGPSSPAATSTKKLFPSHAQNPPLSAGVSRSSSVTKARPQPSRSAPSSRGNSPRGNSHDWKQAFSSNSQSVTTPPTIRSTLTAPTSFNSRTSPMGSSGGRTSTKQALFSSLNQLETSVDIPKRASSTSLTRGKSALLKMDRQSSAGLIMSRNSVQLDKSEVDCVMASTKMGGKIVQTRRSLGSLISPELTCSGVRANHLLEKYVSPTLGTNKRAPQRLLDMDMQHLNLRQDTLNGHPSLITSKPELPSLLSARNVVTQNSSNGLFRSSNSITNVDLNMPTSCSQDGSEQGEVSMYYSNFKALPTNQTDILSSFAKDDRKNNWLDSPVYMNEGVDPMEFFEQGLGKFGSCESPLVCPHGGGAVTCDLCNVKMRLQMLNEKSKASFGANSQILSEA